MVIIRVPVAERFESKVHKTDNCWLWVGARIPKGYGVFMDVTQNLVYAHRFAYEFAKGEIPEGLQIDHLCRNPSCVNPDHLEVVTNRQNVMRGLAPQLQRERQLSKTHCPKGHPYNDENTHVKRRGKHFERVCRNCARDYQRKRRELIK